MWQSINQSINQLTTQSIDNQSVNWMTCQYACIIFIGSNRGGRGWVGWGAHSINQHPWERLHQKLQSLSKTSISKCEEVHDYK